ncbi:MAG: pyridoxal phosphate-dependent aminotransferase [Anaerolineae bacterium]
MIKISEYAQRIEESATMAISARAKAMKKAGQDVIAMAAGEPDFNTPAHIVAAAKQALDDGFTRYTPASGMPELRAAWAEQVGRSRNVTYEPNQLIVTAGGKQAIYNIIYALAGPGDEVIIPAPYWVSYPEQVRAVGATPVILETDPQQDFKISPHSLRQAITERTRLLILNSPSNPTGSVYSRDELAALADVLVEKGVPVLSDEVYDALVYGEEFVSIVSLGEEIYKLTIVSGAVSKTYAMTGWRIGYAAGPVEVIAAAGRLQSHSTSNPNAIAQKAALAAITGDQSQVEAMRQEFDRRRQYMLGRLAAMPHITCPEPRGAFYAFPYIAAYYGRRYDGEVINGSMDFSRLLLEHEKVATVPGLAFGADAHVRLSYATGMAQIEEAMNRMERFLSRLT